MLVSLCELIADTGSLLSEQRAFLCNPFPDPILFQNTPNGLVAAVYAQLAPNRRVPYKGRLVDQTNESAFMPSLKNLGPTGSRPRLALLTYGCLLDLVVDGTPRKAELIADLGSRYTIIERLHDLPTNKWSKLAPSATIMGDLRQRDALSWHGWLTGSRKGEPGLEEIG